MFFDESRHSVIRKMRASAESAEVDVQQKRSDLDFDRAHKLIQLVQDIEKIKDPAVRENVLAILKRSYADLELDNKQIQKIWDKERAKGS